MGRARLLEYRYNLDEEDSALLAYEVWKEREAFENLMRSGKRKSPGGLGAIA
jgi:pre-mRNA-splicing factor ISY1